MCVVLIIVFFYFYSCFLINYIVLTYVHLLVLVHVIAVISRMHVDAMLLYFLRTPVDQSFFLFCTKIQKTNFTYSNSNNRFIRHHCIRRNSFNSITFESNRILPHPTASVHIRPNPSASDRILPHSIRINSNSFEYGCYPFESTAFVTQSE